jgi:serine/threonine protein kinase/formylglycine-generating enzyme required for sulfatase activity/cell division protein FtsB
MLREKTPTPTAPWSPPKAFDEYRLLRLLGRGGMGEVYLAHDTMLDRPVAVKFISAIDPEASAREQFLIEARAAARLQHPNVLTIYRVGELDDHPFLISEFIRGKGLDTIAKPMAWKRALDLGVGLSRGLAAAHRRGVLHRDIKPGNAIIGDDGTVKLVDFGLAKLIDVTALQAELGLQGSGDVTAMSKESAFRDALTVDMPPPSDDSFMQSGIHRTPDPFDAKANAAASGGHHASSIASSSGSSTPISAPRSTPFGASSRRGGASNSGASSSAPLSDPASLPTPVNRSPVMSMDDAPDSLDPASKAASSMVRGTPHYMAPELWRGEPATRRSDVYSLGSLLYELCAGAPPFLSTPLYELPRVIGRRDAPPVRDAAPGIDARFANVIDKCLRRDPTERFASGDELREALERLLHQGRRDSIPEGNPYRGLLSFEAEHRALFFGRSAEIGTLLERLRSDSVVVVVGESGVGKSSLCKAGVLPLVAEGALGGGRQWSDASFVPGRAPVDALATCFAGILGVTEEALAAKIRKRPLSLARSLRKRLGDECGIIVFVDQLEELVTLSDPADAAIAGDAIANLAAHVPGVCVLLTVRGDLLSRVLSIPGLGDELERALYFLRPLSPNKIREAIVGPARAKGVVFESDALIEELVESTSRAEGSLPLLQFALAELWEARANPKAPITSEALAAIGGVTGALARHANNVLASVPREQHEAARKILTALVTLDGTRARRTEEELIATSASARVVLEALVRGRLLVARDAGGGTVYEVAHEALIKGWATLRQWLDEQTESRAVLHRLEVAAAEWERLGRAREALWSARQLAEADALRGIEIAAREGAFLEESRRAVRRRRLRRNVAIVSVPVVLTLLYGVVQVTAHRNVLRRVAVHVDAAKTLRAEADQESRELEDLRRKAFEAFDTARRDDGERLWASARELAAQVDKTFARASQALETALTIDGTRADVRDMLGDVLYDRALAADKTNSDAQRDDLLQRMALYDVSGERARRWSAPAEIAIGGLPSGARATIAHYVKTESGARYLDTARDLGATPISALELPQGSYVLTFEAPDRVTVRYPVLLERADRLRISVDMPRAAQIPKGYVYIPAGRFLFGTSTEESMRTGFLTTVPQHVVTTGAYLIAQNETTYGDWIEYLRALPPEERARRTPKALEGGLSGGSMLEELPTGQWRLTIQPHTKAYTVKAGEKLVYASRSRRAAHDWLRFPVSALSRDDGVAYAAWLNASGRVPGARLCSETEWERAARGADDREYPSGDRLEPDDANFDETYGKDAPSMGPDEVGSHPASRSPFGIDDMAGNIYEWTVSALAPNEAVIRGGAYYYGSITMRSTNRTILEPTLRDQRLGLRVCASLTP